LAGTSVQQPRTCNVHGEAQFRICVGCQQMPSHPRGLTTLRPPREGKERAPGKPRHSSPGELAGRVRAAQSNGKDGESDDEKGDRAMLCRGAEPAKDSIRCHLGSEFVVCKECFALAILQHDISATLKLASRLTTRHPPCYERGSRRGAPLRWHERGADRAGKGRDVRGGGGEGQGAAVP